MPLTKVSSGVIAANAVVDSFGTQSITGDKLGLTAINANNIVNASITGAKIALGTITGDDIATGQITGNLIATNAISQNNIVSVNASVVSVGTLPTARLPAGTVLQVVSNTKIDTFTTTSGTPVDVTGLLVDITPISSSSKILVLAQIFGGGDASTALYVNIVRNSTALNQPSAGTYNSTIGSYFGSAALHATYPIMFLDSPNTTSSTTYKIQIFTTSGAVAVINRRPQDTVIGGTSTITIMEIAG